MLAPIDDAHSLGDLGFHWCPLPTPSKPSVKYLPKNGKLICDIVAPLGVARLTLATNAVWWSLLKVSFTTVEQSNRSTNGPRRDCR